MSCKTESMKAAESSSEKSSKETSANTNQQKSGCGCRSSRK